MISIIYHVPSKRHCIASRARSLLELRLHYVYAVCLTGGVAGLNQVKNMGLESTYHWIGPEGAFDVWTLEFLVEILGERLMHYTFEISELVTSNSISRLKTRVQHRHPHHRPQKVARVPRVQSKAVPRPAATEAAPHPAQENEAAANIRRRVEKHRIKEIRIFGPGLACTCSEEATCQDRTCETSG